MNTQFSSELFLLHDALNDPIGYEGKKKRGADTKLVKAATNPFSWLPKILDWLSTDVFRAGRAIPSA